MEPTQVPELQSSTKDDSTFEILKEFHKEATCTTTSDQVNCQGYGLADVSQITDNTHSLSAEKPIQNEGYSSGIVNSKLNDSSKSEKTSVKSDKESYIDYSIASKYLESLNAKFETLSETEKAEDKCSQNDIPGTSTTSEYDTECIKRRKIEIFGPDVGPKIYHIKGNLVTPPIITKNLPEAFNVLPIHGRPGPNEDVENFYSNKIREFVGCDLNDEQFENLAKFCSPDHLRTGKELRMTTPVPTLSVLSVFDHREYDEEQSKLCIVKKHRLRMANDPANNYQRRLKYRGVRLMPLNQIEDDSAEVPEPDLEPGRDIIYHVRIYRPFPHNIKEKQGSCRHSVFSRDVVLVGRLRLSALRDRVVCANDVSMRVDTADAPHEHATTAAKELFPSGFLFINNVFYVDARAGCADRAAPLRAWARRRGLGDFVARDLHTTRLDDVSVRLGHPEVYVHQGNCEHLFTFSEIRLLTPEDPLSTTQYPAHTAVSQNQSIYCMTCAEFGAKWIVVGCSTVPFDPAYFCDTCFKMYLYKDGKKIGDFKAYSYRGNELNVLKPSG